MDVIVNRSGDGRPIPPQKPSWVLKEISKAFPGVQALDCVSMEIFPGEVHALIGENGSGKSTLAKCLAGVHQPESGEVFFQNKPIVFHNPMEAKIAGVATIYQEFSLVAILTVAENIFLGRYPHNSSGMIDWKAVHEGTRQVLEQLSLDIDSRAVVKELSVAKQQLVEIAKAISMESSLLIMDEPTASLDPNISQLIRQKIKEYVEKTKTATLWTSHNMQEIEAVCDQVLFLSHGRILLSGNPKTLPSEYGKKDLEELFITVAREPLFFGS